MTSLEGELRRVLRHCPSVSPLDRVLLAKELAKMGERVIDLVAQACRIDRELNEMGIHLGARGVRELVEVLAGEGDILHLLEYVGRKGIERGRALERAVMKTKLNAITQRLRKIMRALINRGEGELAARLRSLIFLLSKL